ncbi:MAG: hypothetical protein IPN59_16935 [Holophaga sp.]|nr:hypothetical protein [Holophaga sp.]
MILKPIFALAQIALLAQATEPSFSDIGVDEIQESATATVEGCNYFPSFKSAKVSKLQVLAWYREKAKLSDLPGAGVCLDKDFVCFVDCALVWAEANTESGKRWFLVQMARNPMHSEHRVQQMWHVYMVLDGDDGICHFAAPPKFRDIQKSISNFRFKSKPGWVRYASHINEVLWREHIGGPTPAL